MITSQHVSLVLNLKTKAFGFSKKLYRILVFIDDFSAFLVLINNFNPFYKFHFNKILAEVSYYEEWTAQTIKTLVKIVC